MVYAIVGLGEANMVSTGQASVGQVRTLSHRMKPQPAGRISSSEKLPSAHEVFQQIESDPPNLLRIISLSYSLCN